MTAAKSAANTANARQGLAQTPEHWQRVRITWQVAVNNLRQIPNTTTSFAEAQRLLPEYESKLSIVRDRLTHEQLSKQMFVQATTLARKAVMLQQQNQWTQAVVSWRTAISQMKQVSEGTVYYEQAQSLVASYSDSLEQAESQLRVAVAQQKIRADLNQVCSGSTKMCVYVISNDVIRVQFTPSYEKALQQAYAIGEAGNYSALGGAVNHMESLQTAFQAISTNAGVPLEVYSANGADLLGSFNPGAKN